MVTAHKQRPGCWKSQNLSNKNTRILAREKLSRTDMQSEMFTSKSSDLTFKQQHKTR